MSPTTQRRTVLAGIACLAAFRWMIGTADAVPTTPIDGATYYVSPGGSGVSTDRDAPGAVNDTIRRVCDDSPTPITGGDAIVFLDGTYLTSSFDLPLAPDEHQPGRGGNAIAMLGKHCGAPRYLKLLADNPHGARIVNDVLSDLTSGGFDIRNSSYIWIEGFDIVGANSLEVPFDGGIEFGYGGDHFVARNNRIENTGRGGIGIGDTTHVRIEGNEIHHAGGSHPNCASGISLFKLQNPAAIADDASGYANYVIGNRVFGTRSRVGCDADANPDNGVHSSDGNCIILDLFNATGYANRTLVANNLCVDNGGGGVHVYNAGHADVFNNTLYGNGAVYRLGDLSVTCAPEGETRDVHFVNNLVWSTSGAAAVASNFDSDCTLTDVTHSHNVFVGNAPLIDDFVGIPYLPITTDLTQLRSGGDANLVGVTAQEIALSNVGNDPATADFSVVAGDSPAVDAGVSPVPVCTDGGTVPCGQDALPEYLATDVAGKPRIRGATIDVGATEYDGFGTPITPPASSIVLRAAATLAGGVGAHVDVRVNGAVIGSLDITNREPTDYIVPVPMTDPVTSVDIVFINDDVVGDEDRNLYVASVIVNRRLYQATDPAVSIDRGSGDEAFDGIDVMPGQPGIWWNAAMRIAVAPP